MAGGTYTGKGGKYAEIVLSMAGAKWVAGCYAYRMWADV